MRAELADDGWGSLDEELPPFSTTVMPEPARTIISRNDSPDIPFDQSINPYQGCEHGCIYCYARPSHAYLNLSPGLDFETKLFYKPDAAKLLEAELAAPGYVCSPITIGANTDPYQPIEKRYRVTRSIIEVLARRFNASNELRLFVATGILGGFTTFSAFSLDFAVLWERGALASALGYALASVIWSILALFLGLWRARSFA